MITDSMGPKELHQKMDAAMREAMGRCLARAKVEVQKRIRSKTLKTPYKGYLEFERDHTKYYVDYIVHGGKNSILINTFVYAIYESGYGKKAVCKIADVVYDFGPHFFSRYFERNHVDKAGDDLIKHFFDNNTHFRWQDEFKRKDGAVNDMMFSCDEGAFFGQMYQDDDGDKHFFAFEAVTFLSNENMTKSFKGNITAAFQEILEETRDYENKFGIKSKVHL